MNKPADPYQTVTADISSMRATCSQLWTEEGQELAESEQRFDWYYVDNPTKDIQMYALADAESQETIGTITVTARDWFVKNKSASIAIFGDLFVDPKHRSLGPALKLVRDGTSAAKAAYQFLYSFPNRKAEPVFRRIGFKKIGGIPRYSKPLVTSKIFQEHEKLGKVAFLSPLADLLLALEDRFKLMSLGGLSGEVVADTDSRFDQLWQDCDKEGLMIGQRDAEYLRWRFINNYQQPQSILAVSKRGESSLFGYVVFYKDAEGNFEVHDFLCRDGVKHIAGLMLCFMNYARSQKGKSVSTYFYGSNTVAEQLGSIRMEPREERAIYTMPGDSPNAEVDGCDYYLTYADEDQ